ncbi:MAG: tetratricopeptide repeat-containing sensor histidine kinase [Bacteroidota bacterium]
MPIQPPVSAQAIYEREYGMADSFFKAKLYDESLPVLDHLLSKKIADTFKAEIFIRKAYIFFTREKDDSAIGFYNQALEICTKQKPTTRLCLVYRNIGDVHFYKKSYDDALHYYNLSLAVAPTAKDSLTRYFDICNVYQIWEQYSKVYDVIVNHILKYEDSIVGDQAFMVSMHMGLYYNSIKNHDSALSYYRKARWQCNTDENLAIVYSDISHELRLMKKYSQALSYLDSASMLIKMSGNNRDSLDLFDGYSEIYSENGDIVKALKYAQLARKLNDTIYTTDRLNASQEAKIKYETAEKEKTNQLQAVEISIKQRNLIFSLVGLGLVALLGAISFRSYKQKQKANYILTVQRNQVQQLANELEVANQTKARLFSTISHDLRSPVSSLYAMLKMQEIKGGSTIDAATMSSHTIKLLDTLEDLLVWSKTQMDRFVPMPVLLDVRELYDELISFFSASSVAKNVPLINEAMPGLALRCDENILRTMLRNAISNAISHAPSGTSVVLTSENKNAVIVCLVKNQCSPESFKAYKQAFENVGVQSGSHGLGLVMIKEFAAKVDAVVTLEFDNGWASMKLSLPGNV